MTCPINQSGAHWPPFNNACVLSCPLVAEVRRPMSYSHALLQPQEDQRHMLPMTQVIATFAARVRLPGSHMNWICSPWSHKMPSQTATIRGMGNPLVNLVVLLRLMPKSFKIIIPWQLFKASVWEMESWQNQTWLTAGRGQVENSTPHAAGKGTKAR